MEKPTVTPELGESFSSKTSDADDEGSVLSGSKVSELSLPVQDGTYLSRNLYKSAVSSPKKHDSEMWPFNSSRFIEGIEPPCVKISSDGFEPENISIMEGQTVTFLWEEYDERLSFYQVVHDGEMPIPVRGGYSFMVPQERISRQLFNLRAEYKFMLLNVHGPILTINVHDRIDLEAHITNTGFQPEVIYITKGHSIIWKWDGNAIRHTVQEMIFCQRHTRFVAKNPEPTVGTLKGTHRQQFRGAHFLVYVYNKSIPHIGTARTGSVFSGSTEYRVTQKKQNKLLRRPGIYYFRTESCVLNKFHYCAVVVTETCREHKIEVLDEAFQPMILLIEEGETVWWQWSRAMCKRYHAIYQIKPPDLNSSPDDPFEPMENGFAWLVPSIQGLMAYKFTKPGTYYFSDQNHEFSATFMGTIIVKSKPKEHVLEVNAQTGFSNDLIHAQSNDRIWWLWKEKDRKDEKVSTINEVDRTLNPLAKNLSCSCQDKADSLEEEEIAILKTLGIGVVTLSTIGVYTYTVSCVQDIVSTCSVIVQASSKNHTVHITEDGFERHYITVRANDYVWWVWQNEKHPHNIVQVTYENEIVTDGFCSGSVRDSPSAFMHQFSSSGVYYYKSNSLKKIGTIVVEKKTQVKEVDVSIIEIRPNPILVNVNDILCWVFKGQRKFNVYEVNNQKKMISCLDENNEELTPRRCVAKVIKKSGLTHFASKSFLKQKGDKDSEIRLSSVIADIVEDGILIHIDKNGFHPSNIIIEKGQCIMWKWTESHNIVHVNYSNNTEISGVINGKNSFTSGKPVCNSQYTYSFHCEGDFTVVSQGAIGYSCHIKVMKNAPKMATPKLKETNSQVYKHGVLWLEFPMELSKESNVKIYFTFNGAYPHCYYDTTMVYNQNEGILLENTGIHIIRAVATCIGFVDSEVFNSRRINVLPGRNKNASQDSFQEKHSFESIENGPSEEVWKWWSCKPCLKVKKLEPGQILVTWELRDAATTHLIKGYKLYINDVAYNKMCHQNTNRLTVKGLAGGREYKFYLLAFSTLPNMKPVQSNTVTNICPSMALSGGPLISLEWIDGSNSLCIVWLPIEEYRVVDYWVYRDAIKCGKKVTHQSQSNRCRVILENWTTNLLTKVHIEAVPQVWNDMSFDPIQETKKSNVLEVKLPLLTKDFELSPLAKGPYPKETYMEYITVIDDSAFPLLDDKKELETEEEEEETETETEEDEEEETEEDEEDSDISSIKTDDIDKCVSDYHGDIDKTSYTSQKTEENSSVPTPPIIGVDKKSPVTKSPVTKSPVTKSPVTKSPVTKEMIDNCLLLHIEEHNFEDTLHLNWDEPTSLDPAYKPIFYTVNVCGINFFPNVNSDSSYECKMKDGENFVNGMQHSWKIDKGNAYSIQGLMPENSYRIWMTGTYQQPSNSKAEKMIYKSPVTTYTRPKSSKRVSYEDQPLPDFNILLHIENESEEFVLHWEESPSLNPVYEIENYTVNISGKDFESTINSNKSHECNIQLEESIVRGLQHYWDTLKEKKCSIKGLKPNASYSISVIGIYKCLSKSDAKKITCKSSVIKYTIKGPPGPPKLTCFEVDLYQVSFCIEPPEYLHQNVKLKGFKIYIDSVYTGKFYKFPAEKIIEKLEPGCTITITAVAVTDENVGESRHSASVQVTCPHKPTAPVIKEEPSYKKGCALITWNKPLNSEEQNISSYRVFLDDEIYGEICSNTYSNKNGYQFLLTELSLHKSYKVFVKTICGQKHADLCPNYVCLMSDSISSNILWVRAATDPRSPKIFIKKMSPEGIDIGWESQENAENTIAGYQILKNGETYGAMIPVDVTDLLIHDVNLGDQLTLQPIALKMFQKVTSSEKEDQSEKVSENMENLKTEMETYNNCEVGVQLPIHFTDLTQPPSKVWCEKVTGHSALIVWKKEEKLKEHFIQPESYVVSWWPSNKTDRNYRIDHTTEDHFVLSSLQYDTPYTVLVESKVLRKYSDMDYGEEKFSDNYYKNNTFPVISKAEEITVKTAKPPEPPSSLGVIASTCCSVKIAWDPPKEHGVEISSLYLQCQSIVEGEELPAEQPQFLCVRPDVKEAVFQNLAEKTWYLLQIFAVTDEYFDWLPANHRLKKLRYIPEGIRLRQVEEESIWLPFSTLCFQTSGTDPATNLQIFDLSFTSVTLTWVNAIVHGSNQVLRIVVRWVKVDANKTNAQKELIGQHKVLPSDADSLTINSLSQGTQYSFTVETVVNLRTSLDLKAKKNFRTVNVASKPLLATTRASVEQPKLFIERYNGGTVVLSWKRPSLTTVLEHDKNGKMYLMCHLLGYQVKINDKLHAQLWPNNTSCTLQKCKPEKKYRVQLVAMSSIQEKRKLKKWELDSNVSSEDFQPSLNSQDLDIDQTVSETLEFTLPPKRNGSVIHLDTLFCKNKNEDEESLGSLYVQWSARNKNDVIKQFNVTWWAHRDQVVNTRVMKPDACQCLIPVDKRKCLYEVNVQCILNSGEVIPTQSVQVITPGEPDPPEIMLKSVDSMKFEIGWQEPKTYGLEKIRAYQIHVNSTVVAEVQNDQFTYTYMYQPNCVYKVSVVALGNDTKFGNSPKSNTLIINPLEHVASGNHGNLITKMSDCLNFKNFLKATKVSDTCIYLDWSSYIAPDNVGTYKIQWNSVAQPKEKEIVQNSSNQHCVITKCLSGVTHYLQLIVIDLDGKVIEKSNHLTVQTAAPPNTPVLNVRVCNFHCICVQWTKPLEYGDATICKYNIFVNDEIINIQPADQTSFTFNEGVPCTDYTFQVQALTTYNMPSKLSEPLTLTWPGVKPPSLKTEGFFSDSPITVIWNSPYVTDSIKIKHFKVECFDATTGEIVDERDLLPPESREAKFHGLKLGKYYITQKIYVHGTDKVICSESVEVQVVARVPAPTITINVEGLEKRKKLIKMACHLVNTRDNLIKKSFLQNKDGKKIQESSIFHIEDNLQKFISELSLDTGKVHLDIEWECSQSESESSHIVEGYQIFVDGKLTETIYNGSKCHIMIQADGRTHQISMKTLSNHPSMTSEKSNVVDVPTSPFLPFTFYCNSTVHIKNTRWPNPGCCQFVDSFNLENGQKRKKLLNPGVLLRPHPLPDCTLKNLLSDKMESLLALAMSNVPLLILIWTPWCLPSQTTMKMFVKFAEKNEELFSYVSVCCDGDESTDKASLAKFLDENRLIKHFSNIINTENMESDFRKLLGIEEVPTFLIVDVDGNLVWQGRYCAPHYKVFESFLHHTLHEIFVRKNKNCNFCKLENDPEFVNQLLQETNQFLEWKYPVTFPPRPKSSISRSKKMLSHRKSNASTQMQTSFNDNIQEEDIIMLDLSGESRQEICGSRGRKKHPKFTGKKSKY